MLQGLLLDLDAATLTVWVNGEWRGYLVRPGMTASLMVAGATASSSEEEQCQYWTLLDSMRPFKQAAQQQGTTLRRSIAVLERHIPILGRTSAAQQATKKLELFRTVERHCAEFTRRCDDTPQSYQLQPNLAHLKYMAKLLTHIFKKELKLEGPLRWAVDLGLGRASVAIGGPLPPPTGAATGGAAAAGEARAEAAAAVPQIS